MVNRAEVMDVAAIMAIYERLLVVMGIRRQGIIDLDVGQRTCRRTNYRL